MELFDIARKNMVSGQVLPNGVSNPSVIEVLSRIPRHIFVSDEMQGIAYFDGGLPVGYGRNILPPLIFAKMLEAMEITGGESVLDIACGTGYSSAVLANLCKKVVAVESESELASKAHLNLNKIGVDNVIIMVNPLAIGHETGAPYDAILINGAVKEIPEGLFAQLGENGRLVVVIADDDNSGKIMLYKKDHGSIIATEIFDVNVTPIADF